MENLLSSFEYGLPAAILMLIYLVIVKIIDARKEKKQGKISENLVESFTRLNKFLEYFTKDIIEKEQDKCTYAIKNSFNSFANALIKFSITTIINNNVDDNKDAIIDNTKHLVSTEYWNVYSSLTLFKSSECKVSDYLEQSWKDELTNDIINIIFAKNKSKEQRIYNVNNKIHIDIDSYCIKIINKYGKFSN